MPFCTIVVLLRMQVALVGYGKMGRKIEEILLQQGHSVSAKIDFDNKADLQKLPPTQVAIEFSNPDSCLHNIEACLKQGIPVVVGTTGWYEHIETVKNWVKQYNGTLIYASNFSIGVNVLFQMNEYLAKIMQKFDQYNVEMTEEHHIHKLDAPSGTAISLANGITENLGRKKTWSMDEDPGSSLLKIVIKRHADTIGFHSVRYYSKIDELMITHNAFNRDGFAQGAVLAAEWISGKKGFFEFKDCLNLPKS